MDLQLGKQSPLPKNPNEAVLDFLPNRVGDHFIARFTVPEFTSLCPVTGQPDYARIIIDYLPNKFLIESKSLKLFMGAFRNHGAFHESCTMEIAARLKACEPLWMRIVALWYPRGGIPIDVFFGYGKLPEGVKAPPFPELEFRGR